MRQTFSILCIALVAVSVASAAANAKVTAVEGARVEVGDGTVIDGATVVIDGDRVVAVGAIVAVPAGAVRIDGRGKTLTPGLIATGVQIGLFEVGMEDPLVDTSRQGLITPAFHAAAAFNPFSFHLPIHREEGITTAILSPTGNQLVSGGAFAAELRENLDARPNTNAQPLAMMGAYNGAVADRAGGARGALLSTLKELIDDVRFFKANRTAYDRAQSRTLAVSRNNLEAMIPVVDGRVPFFVHADRAADIAAVLDFAAAEKIKVGIVSGGESWLLAERLSKAKVPVVLVPSWSGEKSFDKLHARDDLAAVLHAAGVDVVITTWDTDNGTSRVRQEAGIAVQKGLPRAAALQAITDTPARIFGVKHNGQKVGVLAPGARATMVLWSGDPLEGLSVAERVWVAGEYIATPSRQRQLADKYLRYLKSAGAIRE
jgi:imidazolonepropionase-like amidohydrolase